jgi:hypothetical protein
MVFGRPKHPLLFDPPLIIANRYDVGRDNRASLTRRRMSRSCPVLSRAAGVDQGRTALQEDIPFFAVLAQVQPLHFVFVRHSQTHRRS